jgi:uncharacterized membrane protein
VNLSKVFAGAAAIGVVEAVYHAWTEGAFVTNYSVVSFSPYASLFGVPYWAFGLAWFPLVFVVALWSTSLGKEGLPKSMLALVSVGNMFTVYLWYLDFNVVNSFTSIYAALYFTNYVLTALVVLNNWSNNSMRGYVYGTFTGALVGLLFGPYGVAACGVGGGIFGALRNYAIPARGSERIPASTTTKT